MQGRFKMEMEYRLFTIVRYNYRDYCQKSRQLQPLELHYLNLNLPTSLQSPQLRT